MQINLGFPLIYLIQIVQWVHNIKVVTVLFKGPLVNDLSEEVSTCNLAYPICVGHYKYTNRVMETDIDALADVSLHLVYFP